MTFPSFAAFGGFAPPIELAAAEAPKQKTLEELKAGPQRLPDTYIYDYPSLVRDDPRPFATLGSLPNKPRVAVIGSGFAGVTAAYELQRAGLEPVIYEARPKPGGRADSRTFEDAKGRTYHNEMGPMRMPDGSKLFWHYLSELCRNREPNPTLQPFPNPGVVPTQIIYQGKVSKPWIGDGLPEEWKEIRNGFGEFIKRVMTVPCREPSRDMVSLDEIKAILKSENPSSEDLELVHAYWSYLVEKYQDQSFHGALKATMTEWGTREFAMFATLGIGTGGFGPLFPVCVLEIMRLLLWGFDSEYSPHITMSEIIARFLRDIFGLEAGVDPSSSPRYIAEPVAYVGISESDDSKVVVHSIGHNGLRHETYDYVIVATTLRSMQIRMNLDGAVTPQEYAGCTPVFGTDDHEDQLLRTAIRTPHVIDSSKQFGLLRKKPWRGGVQSWPTLEDGTPVKCILTDSLARQAYFLDPHVQDDDAGVNVLLSYNWGADSTRVQSILGHDQRQKLDARGNANYTLKQAYEQAAAACPAGNHFSEALRGITTEHQQTDLTSVVWQTEPMIYGGFKLDFPGDYVFVGKLVYQYQRPSSRVFLAGNNCTFLGGWIEGAMMSGVNAAAALLRHATGGQHGFRMQALFEPNPLEPIQVGLEQEYFGLTG